jgi:uncharacterized membrane protein
MINDASPPVPPRRSDADKVRQVEMVISSVLRIGVTVSLAVIVAGSVMSYVHHRARVNSREELHRITDPGSTFPRTFGEVWQGIRHARGRSVIIIGLFLLIATPVLRVAISIFAFVYEKDPVFILITSIVLILLLLSFWLGRSETKTATSGRGFCISVSISFPS